MESANGWFMNGSIELPNKGFIFWPVGTGDSTTIVVDKGVIIQIDLRHTQKSKENETTEWPIVDKLVEILPKRNGRPYLAVFVLTHADKDHIQGFQYLLGKVDIGEIWHTPRIFRDYEAKEVLCEDAIAFRKEADRRRKVCIQQGANVQSGDRLLLIGHDDILTEGKYKKLPEEFKKRPGKSLTRLDGSELGDIFCAFIHAPFSDDQAKERNNTSLAMHITLAEGEKRLQGLFLGDREYPTVKKIFEVTKAHSNERFLHWDVLLAPHHCSKYVMFFKGDGEEEASFKKDIMDLFDEHKKEDAVIVSSSSVDFSNGVGDNPPHSKARRKYEEIVNAGNFICTHEHPNTQDPEPYVVKLTDEGIEYGGTSVAALVEQLLSTARGSNQPPATDIGFGCER